MRTNCLLLLMLLGFLFPGVTLAQTSVVRGVVTDGRTGEPLPGVTIVIKGTTQGTITDGSGSYSVTVSPRQTLVYSSVGYRPFEKIVGNSTTVNVQLDFTEYLLEEAVVTAEFGLKRAARAVGAATQSVRGSEIAESGRENFINSLQGRVSGVQITNSGGTPGSSSSVLIRGATSISGNNQPLYVIDGIPMSNSTFNPDGGLAMKSGLSPTVYDRNLDFSNRGSDINSEDIESITVLKGAAAAALYGSDASNGAIIITTKKGKAGKGIVSYSNFFRFDQAYRYPEMQTIYDNGQYGTTSYYYTTRYGSKYPAGTKLYNNLENLFQTGVSQRHNISFEAGNDAMTFRAAASTLDQTGIVPTSDYARNNITVGGTAKLSRWMNVEATLQYANTTNTKVSKGSGGVLNRAMVWPLTDDMTRYLDDEGKIRYPDNYRDVDILNPYFDLYKNRNFDESQRFIANTVVNITPFKDMLLRAQVGWDVSSATYILVRHPQWSSTATGTGSYDQARVNESNPTVNLLASYKREFGKFNASAQVGYHQIEQGSKTLSVKGEKFMVPDFQSINNCDLATLLNTQKTIMRRLQAISGSFEFSFNNMAFLTIRGRNDWSSTLPLENNHYFYPAADLSFIVSELPFIKTHSETFSYIKLRGSITRVGKDAPPLSIFPALEAASTSYGGYRYGFTGPNLKLRPEMNTAWEVGLESRLFRNRLDLDMAYYHTKSVDQIITGFRMSYATGFVLNNMNVGSFKTEGVEMRIAGDIVKNRNWLWNLGLNLTKNWSEVLYLPENLSEYYNSLTWVSGNIRNGIKVGHPITSISGNDFQRNANGEVLIDPSTGLPLANSSVWSVLGNREPKLLFGFNTSLKYKNLSLSALLDGRIGATVVNGTKRYMMQQGYSLESVTMRESGPVVFKGVLKDPYQDTDNPTVNSIAVKMGDLATGYSGIDANWIEKDIHYLRFAEVRLSYSLDKKWLAERSKGIVSAFSIFASGSDLYVMTNYSGIDVVGNSNSSALGGTGGVGFDMFAIAPPRGMSFGVNVTF